MGMIKSQALHKYSVLKYDICIIKLKYKYIKYSIKYNAPDRWVYKGSKSIVEVLPTPLYRNLKLAFPFLLTRFTLG